MASRTATADRDDRAALLARADAPLSATPRPFLKWAGSKRHLLSHLVPFFPDKYDIYWEPFLGSGALFFLLQPKKAVLSDASAPLIETYDAVRENPGAVATAADQWSVDEDTFYWVRDMCSTGRFQRAGQFIYLNKTCWNGLYRVNAKGKFNVPFGQPTSQVVVVDRANLRACATTLGGSTIKLKALDFEKALSNVAKGDFVYLDPPYVTQHNNNGFIDYNERLFTWEDQKRLASLARVLARRGARVVVTNADHADVIELYRGFAVKRFRRHSTLASDVARRTRVGEVILYR